MKYYMATMPFISARWIILVALVVLTLLLAPFAAVNALPASEVQHELVLTGLSTPVALSHAGDGRLFAVERVGVIKIISFDAQGNASVLPAPFLNISSLVLSGGEQGLLGLAFHPDYATNGYLFVNYSCASSAQSACASNGDTIIARYTVSGGDPDVADPGAALVVATIPQDFSNHNGGQLKFEPFSNPADGLTALYIGMGDGGSGDDPQMRAQDLNSLLGKMLRVDVDNLNAADPLPRYDIPSGNPLGDEIWAYGLRNPWRFSFDRLTGDLFIGDVGQVDNEEIDLQPAESPGGENYGWRQCEGTRINFDNEAPDGCDGAGGLVPPILEYTHADGCSVTGGYIYRGAEFDAELGGTYFYADYCDGTLWGARANGQGNWSNEIVHETGLIRGITTFGERHNGELYFASRAGSIYRIRPVSTGGPDLTVIAVDGPTQGNIGQTVSVTTQVQNQGASQSDANAVGYYFTTDPVNEPDQNDSGSSCLVPALDGGVVHICQESVTVPNIAPGSYRLVAIVDDQDVVAEDNENNNDLVDPDPIQLIDCNSQEMCFDGVDNDCDGLVDAADSDCDLVCYLTGESCISDAQCCSNKCRGGRNNKTCKGDATCTPTESPEISCNDGLDNDCDGLIDTADPSDCMCIPSDPPVENCSDAADNDCDGLIDMDDPDCQSSCRPKGDACSANSECCSNKCRGPRSNQTCK